MANTLTFANQTLTDANIFGGISFSHDLNAGDEFTIGNTASASVMFTTDTQLPLYSKDSTNGTFTWTKDSTARGRYYITEVTKQDGMYTVTAYDAMSLLDVSITNLSITYPATASALATLIATYIGCTVQGTINNGTLSVASLDDDLSIRALLSYIAEASGASVKIDGSDHLCFMYYASSGITLTASDYVKINAADYTCSAIDNVTIFNSEGEIQATYGSGGNSLFIGQNPFLEEATNSIAQTIYNQVSGFAYTPLTVDLFDESGLEVGTKATFGTIQTLVMSLSANENGATATSIGSDTRAEYNKSVVVIANEARAIAIDTQSVASAAAGLLSDMQTAATAAGTTLTAIYATAEAADSVLSGMQAAATAAGTTLNGIYADAEAAKASAETASEYAARALGNLSTVQSVAETLTWITQHGTMTLTTDVALDPTHIYFVVDAGGDYVVGGVTYAIVTEPDVDDIGTYYELTIDESLNNYVGTHLALTSEGLWLLPASTDTNKVLIATGAGSVYTTAGTYIIDSDGTTVLASFRADGATIGEDSDGQSRTEISTSGMQIIRNASGTDIQLANLGYGLGQSQSGTVDSAPFYTFGVRDSGSVVGNYSVAEGRLTTASKYTSHAEGHQTTASGQSAHSEGVDTTASGMCSHAEGNYTTASGRYSHAEGNGTTASGWYSHAEGDGTTASGEYSHAEGIGTTASGALSHAQNESTIAQRKAQTTIGEYNLADTTGADGSARGDYILIAGNGTANNARSNALTVGWDGNVTLALDTTAASGTDHDLYAAITALSWQSDVIV